MSMARNLSGIWLLVALAGVGAALFYLPPQIVAHYKAAQELGPNWAAAYLAAVTTGAGLILGAAVLVLFRLWRAGRTKLDERDRAAKNPSQLTAGQQQAEIEANLAAVDDLRRDVHIDADVRGEFGPRTARLEEKQESARLEIAAFGTVSSGKSSLLNALAGREAFSTDLKGGTTTRRSEVAWPTQDRVLLVDTPGLGEIEGEAHVAEAAAAAKNADLVLMVVDGPLRDSEYQLLEVLGRMEKRILVCLNKEDWYEAPQRDLLLGQIAEQARGLVPADCVLAVRSRPSQRTRIRVTASGQGEPEQVEVPADIGPLAAKMLEVIESEGPQLLLANLLLQSRGLLEESRRAARTSLDRRAWRMVERYQWAAGGAAALSPLPLVDVAVGVAVSTKMVVDLARVYRQQIDLETATKLVGQLGKNLIGILGAHAAAPIAGTLAAGLLKTVPGVGTLAGGVLQGLVQALITRWIGGVFITYFRDELQQNPAALAAIARKEWEQATTAEALKQLASEARRRFAGGGTK